MGREEPAERISGDKCRQVFKSMANIQVRAAHIFYPDALIKRGATALVVTRQGHSVGVKAILRQKQ